MENKKSTYVTNCQYIQDRNGDYQTLEMLQQKFKPSNEGLRNGFNGNIAAHFKVNRKTKKVSMADQWTCSDDKFASLHQAIPSALALYRLCAFGENTIRAFGQDGYKCVWQYAVEHIESKTLIVFGEHKGAFSFWLQKSSKDELSKELIRDLEQFITYICSDKFAHPYDGLVAGSVA